MGEPINYRLWAFYYSILVLSRMNESTIKTLRKICGIQSLNQWIIWTLGRRQIYLCDDDDDETNVIDNLSTLSSDFGKSVGSDEIEKEWNKHQPKKTSNKRLFEMVLKWFFRGIEISIQLFDGWFFLQKKVFISIESFTKEQHQPHVYRSRKNLLRFSLSFFHFPLIPL